MKKIGYPIIDVSNKAIEETSEKILWKELLEEVHQQLVELEKKIGKSFSDENILY